MRKGQAGFADDTTVQVQAPNTGKTKTGRFWAYVRDERPWQGGVSPAVHYLYKGSHHCRGCQIFCVSSCLKFYSTFK